MNLGTVTDDGVAVEIELEDITTKEGTAAEGEAEARADVLEEPEAQTTAVAEITEIVARGAVTGAGEKYQEEEGVIAEEAGEAAVVRSYPTKVQIRGEKSV